MSVFELEVFTKDICKINAVIAVSHVIPVM